MSEENEISFSISNMFIGLPQRLEGLEDSSLKLWRKPLVSSINRIETPGPIDLFIENFEGDASADLKNHGGADKAICVYPLAHYSNWLKISEKFIAGSFGENLSLLNVDEKSVCIGDQFEGENVLIEVSQPRQPCWKLARKFLLQNFVKQVEESGFTGWYFRVMREGAVRKGETFKLIKRVNPKWTIQKANYVMHIDKKNRALIEDLVASDGLSESWVKQLKSRLID